MFTIDGREYPLSEIKKTNMFSLYPNHRNYLFCKRIAEWINTQTLPFRLKKVKAKKKINVYIFDQDRWSNKKQINLKVNIKPVKL